MRCDLPQQMKNFACITFDCNGEIDMQELLLTTLTGFDLWSITDWNGGNCVLHVRPPWHKLMCVCVCVYIYDENSKITDLWDSQQVNKYCCGKGV